MSSKKISIEISLPILPGRIEKKMLPCGKPNCICKAIPPKLHGPYYRWTGLIEGRQTSRTLSVDEAKECELRIKNYKILRSQVDKLLKHAMKTAPWMQRKKR